MQNKFAIYFISTVTSSDKKEEETPLLLKRI